VFTSPFRFEVRSVMNRPKHYALHVEWRETPPETARYPLVTLNDERIPEETVAAPLLLDVGPARPGEATIHRLGIQIGRDTLPGVYAGAIRFVSQQAPSAEAMTEHSFPISVVVPRWWQEWSVLVAWLATASVVIAGVYAFLMHWFPAPRGVLALRYMTPNGTVADDRRSFGWSLTGFLAPWRRSRVEIDSAAAMRPWGRSLVLPRTRIEFMRLGLLASRCSCVVVDDGEVRKLPAGMEPDRSLTRKHGYGVSGYEPVFRSHFDSWFVSWASDDSERWVAFRCEDDAGTERQPTSKKIDGG
jgi:hypothetical protein